MIENNGHGGMLMLSNGEGKSTTTFIKKNFRYLISFDGPCFSLGLDFTIAVSFSGGCGGGVG